MNGATLDWDDLRVFLAVARERRLGAAARVLGLDATTVARRLARLAVVLGAEPFELSGAERRLTERGQALLPHAEAAEAAALAAQGEAVDASGGAAGLVRLSVAEGFGTWVLAPGIADFHVAHPGIRLDLVTASGFLNPSKREADMAVLLARPQRGRLKVRKLGEYDLRLYAARGYLERRGLPADRAALRQHSMVGYVPEFIAVPELDYLGEVESQLDVRLRSTSINIQHRMIAAGGGIGILPDFIARHDRALVPVMSGEVRLSRQFWLATHSDLASLARIARVADWLQARVNDTTASSQRG
jgi:DNA-binding transcriptional LysR family regulator